MFSVSSVERCSVAVDGVRASYLTAGDGPLLLLLHGTDWSRAWLPVIGPLAAEGLRPVAVDLPGCGRSGGELTPATATVPALSAWVGRFLAALGSREPLAVAGHGLGGAIAQHLLASAVVDVRALALVNAVTYDAWPVLEATTPEDLLAAALSRPLSAAAIADYLDPLSEPRVARSWRALTGAADSRFTLELIPAL